MTVKIPRRRFNIDIDGKVFVASELSVAYLENARINPHEDSADLAILDSIGEIQEEDKKLFGIETINIIYSEIVKFTFQDVLTQEDVEDLIREFNMKPEEIDALDRSAKAQLKSILLSRKPPIKDSTKKI